MAFCRILFLGHTSTPSFVLSPTEGYAPFHFSSTKFDSTPVSQDQGLLNPLFSVASYGSGAGCDNMTGGVYMGRVEPLIQKVDCLRLHVADLESGLSFYRDKLGLALIWRTEHAIGLRMPKDETEIVLHTEQQRPEIDLKVESADDAAVRIEEAGGKVVVPPFDIQIGRCVVIHDPWGTSSYC
jgi:predicted enzyme related to lactoylglutathione lyase